MPFPVRLEPLTAADFRVSVVLPVFSETDTVREVAQWLLDHLGSQLVEIVIVLSPRSSAASRETCASLGSMNPRVRVHEQQENPGLGRAVREGMARTSGNLVLLMDSDGEMENETVIRMLAEMSAGGHGLVTASRWIPGGGFEGYSRVKWVLNWCFQRIFRLLFWTTLHDLTYGFKLLRGELARGINWEGTLHEIACETTMKPIRLGVSAAEVPSLWTARRQGNTKNRFLRNFRYASMACRILVRGIEFRPCPGGNRKRDAAAWARFESPENELASCR